MVVIIIYLIILVYNFWVWVSLPIVFFSIFGFFFISIYNSTLDFLKIKNTHASIGTYLLVLIRASVHYSLL